MPDDIAKIIEMYGVGGAGMILSIVVLWYCTRMVSRANDSITSTRKLIDDQFKVEAAERQQLSARLDTEVSAHRQTHAELDATRVTLDETCEALEALQSAHRILSDQHTTTTKAFDGFRAQAAEKEQALLKRISDLEADKRSLTTRMDEQAREMEALRTEQDALRKQITDKQAENRALADVNVKLTSDLTTLTIERDDLAKENHALEKRIATLEEQIKTLQTDVSSREREIQQLRTELDALKVQQQTALIITTGGESPAIKVTEGDQS